ncbi:molybdopterin-dependent oxidoreductase [Pedobacter sp. MC2016-14]|uniref:molybdopterin-dependent oxidoreductase n=1 Tax=Pedobacter sp. MC2016-14 TaxID=2897327 RepID=UPI001E621650|nr:molybdopterin-dependent oxidoreductase [Pedobacter sp. MC2016-14]MCD0487792.1 molybdopterin-dependent oxidoreductase [Pedobacter sp. MC2016-14]
MKLILFSIFAALLLSSFNPAMLHAQTPGEAGIKISGEVSHPFVFKASDLQQLNRTEVTRKDKDNKDHIYSGVSLSTLLAKAGVTLGAALRGENLTKYVLAEASDGYQVAFSLAELDPEFTERLVIVADKMDGKALAAADGPFRIIVQDEKKPARCMKQVISIIIAFAK